MVLSSWMRSARPVEGGLLIPGWPHRRGCDFLLTPDGAHLTVADLTVQLPYEDCSTSEKEGWRVTSWEVSRGGLPIGAAVHGAGRYAEPITQLRRRHGVLRHIGDCIASRSNTVPLWAASAASRGTTADVAAMDVLCQALSRRPQWRAQLADQSRTAQLLSDLDSQDHSPIAQRTGARRSSFEFFLEMQLLHLQYPLGGRPLPDDPRPDPDAVVGKVVKALASNKYMLPPDEARVRAMVHKYYLDIPPWPFGALVPGGSSHLAET